jgi:hypothetical protein
MLAWLYQTTKPTDGVKNRIWRRKMMSGDNSRRLVELAFDYVAAESEHQVAQSRDEAARLATETTTFKVWLELIDYIKEWSNKGTHKYPMGRASALQFFLTRQAELDPLATSTHE